ncbi:MAG: hypothetical protein WBM62_20990 [Crocosphaera sp.]
MDAARFVYWSGFHPTANIRVTGVFTPTLKDNLRFAKFPPLTANYPLQ